MDLASEAELAAVEGALRGINAEAGITRCQRCAIDLGLILNTGIYSAAGAARLQAAPAAAAAPAGAAAAAAAAADGGGGESSGEAQCGDPQCCDPAHHHHHHQHGSHGDGQAGPAHDGRVGTVTISLPPGRALDLPRLRHWLDTLLWEGTAEAADLFRIKGLLHVAGSERKHILQARWASGAWRCWRGGRRCARVRWVAALPCRSRLRLQLATAWPSNARHLALLSCILVA